MSKTMTLHVRYTFWYISFPSSAKQQREMTSFNFFWRTGTHEGEFFFSYWTNSVPGQFESTPNKNEQQKLETGNGRSERMRRRFAAVSDITGYHGILPMPGGGCVSPL